MHKLLTGAQRFEKFYQTLEGKRFRGILYPAKDGSLPINTFVEPRTLLRTRPDEPVQAKDMFRDEYGRVLLIGNHGSKEYARTYVLFELPEHVNWSRAVLTINPTTKRSEASGQPQLIGEIWCSIEESNRVSPDAGLRVDIAERRIITAADIKVGDMVGGHRITRVFDTLGIKVADAN